MFIQHNIQDHIANEYMTNAKMAYEEYEIKKVTMDLTTKNLTMSNKAIKLDNIKQICTNVTMCADGYHCRTERYIELKAGRNNIKYNFEICTYKEDATTATFVFYNVDTKDEENLKITIIKR